MKAHGFVWIVPGRLGEYWTEIKINGRVYDWANVADYDCFGTLESISSALTMEEAREDRREFLAAQPRDKS